MSPYNLEYMLPGVLNTWNQGGHCGTCARKTDSPIEGHDGFCPVPPLHLLAAEQERLCADAALGRKLREAAMELLEKRAAIVEAKKRLMDAIDRKTADGQLIMRYGDMPEYPPFEAAMGEWYMTAANYADALRVALAPVTGDVA